MRIGMMADLYKPHISGVTNYISLSKARLEELGHEVYVFTFAGKDPNYHEDEENVIRSPGITLFDTGYSFNLRYNRKSRKLLQTMDIVHVHHPFISGSLALFYCRQREIPIIFTNHTRYDLYTQAYTTGVVEVISETAIETYIPNFCRSIDLVIAPSAGMREVLIKMGVDVRIEVLPNGVHLEPFINNTEKIYRQEFGFSKDDILLIYVGRLGPEKNLQFLLRAFAGAAQAYDHIGLLLVGDGPEKDNLQDRVKYMQLKDKVKFTGLIPYVQLPSYLAMVDGFVTASVTEVHPLSVIEAMASGLPVLGINSPGVGDTIIDGETGYLAKEEDLAVFTAKLVRLVTEHEQRIKMGRNAQQAADKYSIVHTTQKLLEYYEQVIETRKNRKHGFRDQVNRLLNQWKPT
jgi:1,2-diacylglycerol 3-alpha-glucosyltransferase